MSEKKLFYTTSDLMETMNQCLSEMDSPDDEMTPRVELQRRLPDGTIRRAHDKEMEAADMESKLKQAAEQVSHLNSKEKLQWAEHQRLEGNALYKEGNHRAAIDVYLTCLVAKTDDHDFVTNVFLPVMNNLAQCCLQLGMYRKTQDFCSMALNDVAVAPNDEQVVVLVTKLYFRRAKARRLSGMYQEARQDLETAKTMATDVPETVSAIDRELQLLERAETQGRRNEKRQQTAMKRALGGSRTKSKVDTNDTPPDSPSGLSENVQEGRRRYSTLTAKKRPYTIEGTGSASEHLSYWQWYLLVIAGVAERLLVLLGDEEYVNQGSQDEDEDSCDSKDD